MFTTGFQSFAFQTVGKGLAQLVSGLGYKNPYAEYKEKQYQKQKSELQKLDSVLKETERKKRLAEKSRLDATKTKAIQRLLKLEEEYLTEITRLLAVRVELIQRMDETLIILLMMK